MGVSNGAREDWRRSQMVTRCSTTGASVRPSKSFVFMDKRRANLRSSWILFLVRRVLSLLISIFVWRIPAARKFH